MSEPKTALPTCLDCEFGGDFPCRDSEGNLEREKLIEAYRAVANEEDGGLAYDDSFWAFDCMETIVSEEPELALELIVFALTRFTRPDEISFLAAGPLENLVQLHGAQLIDRLERVAAINEQFRLLLSGIWGESSTDPEIWRRIQKAVADGPWIAQDPRTPQGSRKHSGEN